MGAFFFYKKKGVNFNGLDVATQSCASLKFGLSIFWNISNTDLDAFVLQSNTAGLN